MQRFFTKDHFLCCLPAFHRSSVRVGRDDSPFRVPLTFSCVVNESCACLPGMPFPSRSLRAAEAEVAAERAILESSVDSDFLQ